MKLAVMQPYLFPYLGYFQLIHAADKFVVLDDVNFINRGWINRNRIIVNGADFMFTIPVKKASQNKLIMDCELADEPWEKNFLRTIEINYKKTKNFEEVFNLIKEVVQHKEKNLSVYIANQLSGIMNYLQINTEFIASSFSYGTLSFKGQEKILAICKKENATQYINPIGGVEIYDNARFVSEKILLRFLKSKPFEYHQRAPSFIPNLSIIDVLMNCPKQAIIESLNHFELISNDGVFT